MKFESSDWKLIIVVSIPFEAEQNVYQKAYYKLQ